MSTKRGKVLLLALGILLGLAVLGVGEGVARTPWALRLADRMAHAGALPRELLRDPEVYWRPAPNLDTVIRTPDGTACPAHTNAQGLRDDPFPPPGTGPLFTVLCLGDSSTWGENIPQDQTYAQVLEAFLQQQVGAEPRIAVLNGGVPGYSTLQTLRQAKRLLGWLEPQVVTISNLPSDVFPAANTDRVGAEGHRWPLRLPLSRSYLAWELRLVLLRGARDHVQQAPESRVYSPSMVNRVPARPDFDENLRALVALVRARGAEPVLVTPMPLCVGQPCPHHLSGMVGDTSAQFVLRSQADEAPYREVTAKVARSLRVRHVDLAAVRASRADYGALYSDEVHPSVEGHALIAAALLPEVRAALESWRAAAR